MMGTMTDMKKIVVTGASGQLGRRLVPLLALHDDAHLHCIVRDPRRGLASLHGNARIAFVDATDRAGCDAALSGSDLLIHAAFTRSNDGAALAASMEFSRHVFERACALGTAAIVNISSQSVYGAAREAPSREGDAAAPDDRYALAKYASELLLEAIAADTSTRVTQIRLASLIGEGMDERLVTRFVVQAMSGQPLRIQGGNQRFSFLDIEDAAAGLACMLDVPATRWKRHYNLGPAGSQSLLEIAHAAVAVVEAVSGARVPVEVTPQASGQNATMDSGLFRRDFDFVARVDLEATLRAVIARLGAQAQGE